MSLGHLPIFLENPPPCFQKAGCPLPISGRNGVLCPWAHSREQEGEPFFSKASSPVGSPVQRLPSKLSSQCFRKPINLQPASN